MSEPAGRWCAVRQATRELRAAFPELEHAEIWISPGWFGLLKRLVNEVHAIAPASSGFRWTAIRSKYASLRADFEWPAATAAEVKRIEAITARYEGESERTCERCGEPGHERDDDGWIEILCDVHAGRAR